ncbi:unnamed protein product, partial [Mesorhabditis spiculigera]
MSASSVSWTADASVRYERLSAEYSKLRANAAVLKNGVLEERAKAKKAAESLKEAETAMRKLKSENESLLFRNEQLSKRVETLQSELDGRATHKKDKPAKKERPSSNEVELQSKIVLLEEEIRNKMSQHISLVDKISEIERAHASEIVELSEKFALQLHEQGKNPVQDSEVTSPGPIAEDALLDIKISTAPPPKPEVYRLCFESAKHCATSMSTFLHLYSERTLLFPFDSNLEQLPPAIRKLSIDLNACSVEAHRVAEAFKEILIREQFDTFDELSELKTPLQDFATYFAALKPGILELERAEKQGPWSNGHLDNLSGCFTMAWVSLSEKYSQLLAEFSADGTTKVFTKIRETCEAVKQLRDAFCGRWRFEDRLPVASKKFKCIGSALCDCLSQLDQESARLMARTETALTMPILQAEQQNTENENDSDPPVLKSEAGQDTITTLSKPTLICKVLPSPACNNNDIAFTDSSSMITCKKQRLRIAELEADREKLMVEIALLKRKAEMVVEEARMVVVHGISDSNGKVPAFSDEVEGTALRQFFTDRFREAFGNLQVQKDKVLFLSNECAALLKRASLAEADRKLIEDRLNASEALRMLANDELETVRRGYESQMTDLTSHMADLNKKIAGREATTPTDESSTSRGGHSGDLCLALLSCMSLMMASDLSSTVDGLICGYLQRSKYNRTLAAFLKESPCFSEKVPGVKTTFVHDKLHGHTLESLIQELETIGPAAIDIAKNAPSSLHELQKHLMDALCVVTSYGKPQPPRPSSRQLVPDADTVALPLSHPLSSDVVKLDGTSGHPPSADNGLQQNPKISLPLVNEVISNTLGLAQKYQANRGVDVGDFEKTLDLYELAYPELEDQLLQNASVDDFTFDTEMVTSAIDLDIPLRDEPCSSSQFPTQSAPVAATTPQAVVILPSSATTTTTSNGIRDPMLDLVKNQPVQEGLGTALTSRRRKTVYNPKKDFTPPTAIEVFSSNVPAKPSKPNHPTSSDANRASNPTVSVVTSKSSVAPTAAIHLATHAVEVPAEIPAWDRSTDRTALKHKPEQLLKRGVPPTGTNEINDLFLPSSDDDADAILSAAPKRQKRKDSPIRKPENQPSSSKNRPHSPTPSRQPSRSQTSASTSRSSESRSNSDGRSSLGSSSSRRREHVEAGAGREKAGHSNDTLPKPLDSTHKRNSTNGAEKSTHVPVAVKDRTPIRPGDSKNEISRENPKRPDGLYQKESTSKDRNEIGRTTADPRDSRRTIHVPEKHPQNHATSNTEETSRRGSIEAEQGRDPRRVNMQEPTTPDLEQKKQERAARDSAALLKALNEFSKTQPMKHSASQKKETEKQPFLNAREELARRSRMLLQPPPLRQESRKENVYQDISVGYTTRSSMIAKSNLGLYTLPSRLIDASNKKPGTAEQASTSAPNPSLVSRKPRDPRLEENHTVYEEGEYSRSSLDSDNSLGGAKPN